MITVRRAYAAAMAAMLAGAAAGQPVQWRVQDGGNGHWYERIVTAGSVQWSLARSWAQSRGGDLAAITSANERTALATLISPLPEGEWIGLFQDTSSPLYAEPAGGWKWITGEPLAFDNWSVMIFDNHGNFSREEEYAFADGTRAFRDTSGSDSGIHAFLVEYSADCNGDGIVDKGQILSGQLADLNSNGIPDGCENPCVFNRQPQSQALQPGGNAAFSIEFARLGQSFQWRRNGANLVNSSRITGVTTPNLTISAVVNGDQGSYDCVVTGSCGTVTSQAAALSCVPLIMQQPPAEAILVPGASLSVTVPTNASYTYRWRQNGQNLFNIPGVIAGATTRTLTLLSDDSSLVGTYDCVLTNVCGSTTSDATFIPCPADFNLDGGIDGGDVEAFFGDWSAGLGTADLNQDGGVDGADLFTFFTRWEGGC